MKAYFLLQYKILNRKLTEFGTPPFLAYPLLSIGFIGSSLYLFRLTEFAEYLYLAIAFFFLLKLTGTKRNDFLKTCFTGKRFFKLRFFENVLIIAPFICFLAYQKSVFCLLVLIIMAVILTIPSFATNLHVTIPTPFYKQPFEFTVGFRNTFFIFPIAYSLTYIAITVGNFNLGVFSMILMFLMTLSYYSKLEKTYYIWSYSLSPSDFLLKKIKIGLVNTTFLIIPIFVALSLFFYEEIETLSTFLLLCYAYLTTFILAKYATYPHEMNIPQGILIAISLIFPPMLIGIIPYFYHQSRKRLNTILQ